MPETYHPKPLCPYCEVTFDTVAVWIDETQRVAIFFCPVCQKALGAQLLQLPGREETSRPE